MYRYIMLTENKCSKFHLLFAVLITFFLEGCSSDKFVPNNDYLLDKVKLRSDVKTLDTSLLEQYIRQKGNSKWFSLFKVPLKTYSLSGKDTTKWINRTLKKIGEKPVLYDLAKRMGKTRVIAETGAGQHGVATAAAAARFGMQCDIYMGAVDAQRQQLNVFRMELMGATVHAVEDGTATLKNAVDAAFAAWMNDLDAFYVLGSAVGPHPYPSIVHEFQKIISVESRRQILEQEGRLPDAVIACVGGGSNAIGAFSQYIDDENVSLIGVEATGKGLDTPLHAATMEKGRIGIIDGMKTYSLFDDNGEIAEVYSISAGLDYPGVGPEHAFLKDSGRVEYTGATDDEAVDALVTLSKTEGILPAIESSHALAEAIKRAPHMSPDQIIIVNVSGRGDKDVQQVKDYLAQRA